MSDRLEALARRVRDDPDFLASALTEYAAESGLDRDALARAIGCTADQLPRLELCRRPAGERFRTDIALIAERFALPADTLAAIVRRADVLAAWRDTGPTSGLRAARDRDETDREEPT